MFKNAARALTALGLVAAVWAPSQVGAQEQRVAGKPTPVEGGFTFAAGEVCPFAVSLEAEGTGATLELPNGTVIYTAPRQTATVTNLVTGEELELKISGPTQVRGTEAVFVGPALVIRSPLFGDDEAALVYVTGRYTFDQTADPKFSGVGGLTDICAALASPA